jgi:predicted GIY-YIG superfamily endonuclease
MASLYFLYSEKDSQWYIGATALSAHERFAMHVSGRVRSTKYRRPLLLAYIEVHENRQKAMKREWHLKHPAGYTEKLAIIRQLLDQKKDWPLKGPFNTMIQVGE